MSNRSIDGLQRRSTVSTGKKPVRSKNTVSSFRQATGTITKRSSATRTATRKQRAIASARKTISPRTTRNLGIPDSKKELTRLIKKNNKLAKSNRSQQRTIREADEIQNTEKKAVQDFLTTVQDVDPTDLIEIPNSEKKKSWFKAKESKKKSNKSPLKKKIKITGIVIGIAILIAIIIGFFVVNRFIGQVTDDGNVLGLLFADEELAKDKNGRTNILVFGTEGYKMDDPNYDGGFLTDSMMIISINKEENDIKAVSLPRDLKTNTCTSTGKLNEVFWCEYQKNDKSEESIKKYEVSASNKLKEEAQEILGLEVQYYTHVNWAALIQIIDAIDGIDVVFTYGDQKWEGNEVTIQTTSKQGLSEKNGSKVYFAYPNGQVVHLDGTSALAVARARNAYGGYGASGGNFSREYFQQKIIEATIKKAKEKNVTSNIGSALKIKSAVGDNIRTNFKDSEIKSLLRLLDKINISELKTIPLMANSDNENLSILTTGMINGISYVYPSKGVGNYIEVHNYLKRKLSSEDFLAEEADITVMNGTSAYGLAANEKKELENAGFIVKNTMNAPSDLKGFDGVKIYVLNEEKIKTKKALEKFYEVKSEKETPNTLKEYDSDFIIIIGNGFERKDEE